MLVLARQTNDSILLGDDIEITILEIKGRTVKIGSNAPHELAVQRPEIYVEIKREAMLPTKFESSLVTQTLASRLLEL